MNEYEHDEFATDILGYLQVLGYEPVLKRLSASERRVGKENICGCFVRMMDFLEQNYLFHCTYRNLHSSIQFREHLNCQPNLPVNDPSLLKATAATAEILYRFIRGEIEIPQSLKNQFLGKLDNEFVKILGTH